MLEIPSIITVEAPSHPHMDACRRAYHLPSKHPQWWMKIAIKAITINWIQSIIPSEATQGDKRTFLSNYFLNAHLFVLPSFVRLSLTDVICTISSNTSVLTRQLTPTAAWTQEVAAFQKASHIQWRTAMSTGTSIEQLGPTFIELSQDNLFKFLSKLQHPFDGKSICKIYWSAFVFMC